MVTFLSGPFGLFVLEAPTYTLGSAPDNQIVIPDGKVSPAHALLQFDGQGYQILDLGSATGTYLNGQRLVPNILTPLQGKGEIRLGDTVCSYEVASPQVSPWPASLQPAPVPGSQISQGTWHSPSPPPPPPPSRHQRRHGLWIILLVICSFFLVGSGAGVFVYINTRPQPTLLLTSNYVDGTTPVGAAATTFHLTGQKFSSNSAITFLLDGRPAPGSQSTLSDANGDIAATLAVTAGWPLGKHSLSAEDASGYTTKASIPVEIVAPGQDETPGPNGAPPDNASGTILASLQTTDGPETLDLIVTGEHGGGTVCRSADDGQTHTQTGVSDGETYTETVAATCSGMYKEGKLTYTETVTSDQIAFANGLTCTAQVPYVGRHLEGNFSSSTAISGTYSSDTIGIRCNKGVGSTTLPAQSGTWSGVAAME